MFTGIIKLKATALAKAANSGGHQLQLLFPAPGLEGLECGASVAVDGVCLTVTDISDRSVTFDLLPETVAITTLGAIIPGKSVHIERAVKVGDELGGHLLTGHVSGVATVRSIERQQSGAKLLCKVECRLKKYLMVKGSIALDGVSLTIVDLFADGSIELQLIPETLRRTNFGEKKRGQLVNVEVDTLTQGIVNTVERMLQEKIEAP